MFQGHTMHKKGGIDKRAGIEEEIFLVGAEGIEPPTLAL
tara:strand:- start:41676 stop:41792 length:117 start_codon:yes stop_codon:yes gene_type:complete